MQINIHAKHIELNEEHKEYIMKKIGRLAHYDKELNDESVICDVHVEKSSTRTQGLHVEMTATIQVPGNVLRAEVMDGMQVTEAVDILSEKLERQVDKYKGL
jgi:putative sigma-54 modulation protein